MGARRFDWLSDQLGAVETRRCMLCLVAGLPLAGMLASLDAEKGQAKRKRHGRRASHRPGTDKNNRKGLRSGGGKGGDRSNDGPLPGSGNCPDGVLINGGCFAVGGPAGEGCNRGTCDGFVADCAPFADECNSTVCVRATFTECHSHADCLAGQACNKGSQPGQCYAPC